MIKTAAITGKLTSPLIRSWGRLEYGLIALVAVYALVGYIVARMYGLEEHFVPFHYSNALGLITFFLFLGFVAGRVGYVMVKVRPRRLTLFLYNDFKRFLFEKGRVAKALPIFLCFMVFMSCFTSMKVMLPAINPFSWDPFFVRFDKTLHFGVDPWRLLLPVLGYPVATAFINAIYNCWFFIMFGFLYWQLFAVSRPQLRMRFFYTYILSWLVNGTILAMILSSAGPCFYEGVTGSDYFEPLMGYLAKAAETVPVWALTTQQTLWDSYLTHGLGFGSGISAMPSMHVSVAFIFMLVGWRVNRFWGWLFTAYTLLILIGSVHLAWHYAIDGYLSIVTTWLIWWLSGTLVKKLS